MNQIQKIMLTTWIVITIITIIPNIVLLIKCIKVRKYDMLEEGFLHFICLLLWCVIGIATFGLIVGPLIYNLL